MARIIPLAVMVALLAGCAAEVAPKPVARAQDKGDRFYVEQAETRARVAPIGVRVAWTNPESGHSGAIVATRDAFDRQSGAYCRDFQTETTAGGPPKKATATICRRPDGAWRALP